MDHLSAQLVEAQAAAADKRKAETSLANAERAREVAEAKLAGALREAAGVKADMERLRQELARVEVKQARAGNAAAEEVDKAIAEVGWGCSWWLCSAAWCLVCSLCCWWSCQHIYKCLHWQSITCTEQLLWLC